MSIESVLPSHNVGVEKVSSNEEFDLTYTLDTSRENKSIYLFKNVGVIIDKSGKNIEDVPEILFGVFSGSPEGDILAQPETPVEGVTMKYIAACVEKVVADCGEQKLWFYPYGDDVDEEEKERRVKARLRLFSRSATITPGPDNYGYIINI